MMVFSSLASLVLRAMYIMENRRRDREAGSGANEGVYDEKHDKEGKGLGRGEVNGIAWGDLTDKQNPYFRYVY